MHLTNYAINKRSNKYTSPGKSEQISSEAETRSTTAQENHHTSLTANNERVAGSVQVEQNFSTTSWPNTKDRATTEDRTASTKEDHKDGMREKGLEREKRDDTATAAAAAENDGGESVIQGQDAPVEVESGQGYGGGSEGDGRDERGSKRSLEWFFRWLEEGGRDAGALWREVENLVVKTLASAQPSLAQAYRSCFCGETRRARRFLLCLRCPE